MCNTAPTAQGTYIQLRRAAYDSAITAWKATLGVDLAVWDWGPMASSAYRQGWAGRSATSEHWDWEEIQNRYRDYDRLPLAVFGPGGDLWIAGLALITRQSVHFRFLEGTPDHACPIRTKRAFIAFDIAARYGQALGKTELII